MSTFESDKTPWHEMPMDNFATYGGTSRAKSAHYKFVSFNASQYDPFFQKMDEVHKSMERFNDQINEWVPEYENLSPEDKVEQVESVANAISSILGPSLLYTLAPRYQVKYREWDIRSDCKTLYNDMIRRFEELYKVTLSCAMSLVNNIGYSGRQVQRWFVWHLYSVLAVRDYSSFAGDPILPKTDALFQPHYDVWFKLIEENASSLYWFCHEGGAGYLYQWMVSWIDYIKNNSDQVDNVRGDIFKGIQRIMGFLDHFTLLCSHPHNSTYQIIAHIIGLLSWITAYASALEVKKNGPNGQNYELFSSKLAYYHYWILQYIEHCSYRDSAREYYTSYIISKYHLFERQIILHKKSLEHIKPVWELFYETYGKNWVESSFWNPPPSIEKLKPTFAFITKLPELKDLQSYKTLSSLNDSSSIRSYFQSKIDKCNNNEDSSSVFSDKDFDNVVSSPLDLFVHENKKNVDPNTIFGKIKIVTGNSYDYRVKVVTSNGDLKVTQVSGSTPANKPGLWKIITTGVQDWRIKIVKGLNYDFTIQYN